MLTRRFITNCALCSAIAGLVATEAEAQTAGAPAQTSGVTRTIMSRTELPGGTYATILVAAEIAPGATVARHTHPGVESAYLLDGECELMVDGQPDRTLKAADGFQIPPGMPHSLRNGPKAAKLAITYTVEKDKPLASPA